jgi:N-acetylglucosamine malate deacetylase 1
MKQNQSTKTDKLFVLAFGAHPDDVELSCGGTLYKHAQAGKKTGIIDLTQGELGTRGTVKIRQEEAKKAALVINCAVRENLKMPDGFFLHDKKNILKVVAKIRQYRPDVVLCNAPYDRHPDHGRAASLVNDACFLAGLQKLKTTLAGKDQLHYRPLAVYHYVQFKHINPDHLVDISNYFDAKMKAVWCHSSQFHNPKSKQPETFISKSDFMESYVLKRAEDFGQLINVAKAEGFIEAHANESDIFLL